MPFSDIDQFLDAYGLAAVFGIMTLKELGEKPGTPSGVGGSRFRGSLSGQWRQRLASALLHTTVWLMKP